MKKQSRKLNLNRETLAPLQSAELSDVNGGASPAGALTTLWSQLCASLVTRITCTK